MSDAAQGAGSPPALLLAEQQTRLAFHRSRLGAERTLMAAMRTALSMIAFGFTSFQFLGRLAVVDAGFGRIVGLALTVLGVFMQFLAIWGHLRFVRELDRERVLLAEARLLPKARDIGASVATLGAIALLGVGLSATGVLLWQLATT